MVKSIRYMVGALGITLGLLLIGCSALPGTDTAAAEAEAVQTAPVRSGDITISASGAATVIPANEITFGFSGSGALTELLVKVGDEVAQGDILARLDDTDALQQLATAELGLAAAIMQTDGSATEAGTSLSDLAVEQALLNLETQQRALDELLEWAPDEDEIAQAQASLDAANAGYNAALGQEAASSTNITLEQISLEKARSAVADAQAAYDTAFDPGREWELYIDDPSCKTGEQFPNCTGTPYSDNIERERESAVNAVEQARQNLEIAELNYRATVSGTNYSSSTSARGNVLSAELALQAAQEGPTDDELAAAQTAVRGAEISYQTALLNREKEQKIGLAEAQLSVDAAQRAVDNTALRAPMAGTITAIASAAGEQAASGSLIALADLERPLVEVYLDETDQNSVKAGYTVEVLFDALPDQTFTGTVSQVDPLLSTINGVTTVRALVTLDESVFASGQSLPVGMNGSAEIIGGQSENTLLVPVEALREVSAGSYAVFVLNEAGEPEMRFVEVGLNDGTFAEILSGLELGETVTTGLVATQ